MGLNGYLTGIFQPANAQQCLQPRGQEPCRAEDLCWQRSAPVYFLCSSAHPTTPSTKGVPNFSFMKAEYLPFYFPVSLCLARAEMISPMPSQECIQSRISNQTTVTKGWTGHEVKPIEHAVSLEQVSELKLLLCGPHCTSSCKLLSRVLYNVTWLQNLTGMVPI